MQQEKKRNRTCFKYHYETVKICRETDVIYTRCRVCKELYPSTLDYFRKDTTKDAQRLIQPLCKKCGRQIDKMNRKIEREKEKPINHVEQTKLFEDDEESVEKKIDRIMKYLGLKK